MFTKNEKLSVVILKLIDTFLDKSISSINNHLYLNSMEKLL
jgi:hypothetical protein